MLRTGRHFPKLRNVYPRNVIRLWDRCAFDHRNDLAPFTVTPSGCKRPKYRSAARRAIRLHSTAGIAWRPPPHGSALSPSWPCSYNALRCEQQDVPPHPAAHPSKGDATTSWSIRGRVHRRPKNISGRSPAQFVMRKLPHVTALFWMIKTIATTLGETAGDMFSQTLHLGNRSPPSSCWGSCSSPS